MTEQLKQRQAFRNAADQICLWVNVLYSMLISIQDLCNLVNDILVPWNKTIYLSLLKLYKNFLHAITKLK